MRNLYNFYGGRAGLALLAIRAVVGSAFVLHGLPKIADPAAFGGAMGLPTWLATVAAWTEVLGGGLLVLGFLTPITGFFLAAQMIGALAVVHIPHHDPFVNPSGSSFELAAVYLAVSIAYLLMGPGAYSMDALLAQQLSSAPVDRTARRERGIV